MHTVSAGGGPCWHRHAPRHSHNSHIQELAGRWCHIHMGSAATWGSLLTVGLSRGRSMGQRSPRAAHSSMCSGDGVLRAGWAPRVSLSLAAPSPWGRWHPAPGAQASSAMLTPSTAAWSSAPRAAAGPALGQGHRGQRDRPHPNHSLCQAGGAQCPGRTHSTPQGPGQHSQGSSQHDLFQLWQGGWTG